MCERWRRSCTGQSGKALLPPGAGAVRLPERRLITWRAFGSTSGPRAANRGTREPAGREPAQRSRLFLETAPPLELVALLGALERDGLDVIKTEHLCTFDGAPGYALGHGQ